MSDDTRQKADEQIGRLKALKAEIDAEPLSLLKTAAISDAAPARNYASFELDAALRIYAAMLQRGIALDGWDEQGAVDEAWRRARLFVDLMPKARDL